MILVEVQEEMVQQLQYQDLQRLTQVVVVELVGKHLHLLVLVVQEVVVMLIQLVLVVLEQLTRAVVVVVLEQVLKEEMVVQVL